MEIRTMEQVLNTSDFAAARAVSSTKLKELGFAPVCMAPGAENPGHSHTLVEEILIVQKGVGKIQIEDATFDLCAGSVAIVPAGRFHSVCNTGTENLEGFTVFNSNFDRKKVVLKSRKQHFKLGSTADDGLRVELDALKKSNKKLMKTIKKLKKK
jgi:quercetin dioxygenase-like cupin family protein